MLRSRNRRFRRKILVVLVIGLLGSLAWIVPADASTTQLTATDQVAQGFQVPLTSVSTHDVLPSDLLVASASLSTVNPADSEEHANKGFIYLSLQMTSNPPQLPSTDPNWDVRFLQITPLPASAFRYLAASGKSYAVTRANPTSAVDNTGGSNGDGLVDATYYFTVPLSTRRGTIIISPCRTIGSEYASPVDAIVTSVLDVGGPTRIPVSFPKDLTASSPTPRRSASNSFAPAASRLNFIATMLAGLLVVFIVLTRRRKNKNRPFPVHVVAPTAAPRAPNRTADPASPPTSYVQPDIVASKPPNGTTPLMLRVDVLGPLAIAPVLAPASDPVRAIVSFLAMHNDRPFTLDEIQTAIWPLTANGADIKKPAMRNYMVDARKCVGERHLPTAAGRAGYKLVDFTTDWTRFQGLCAQALQSSKEDAVTLRRQALDLAKGPPFTADTSRYFTWTMTSSVTYKMVATVTALAHDLGTHFVLAGDLTTAEEILRQGLLTDPACRTLWEDLTDVLLESTDQSLLHRHWDSATVVLNPVDVAALRSREQG